MFTKCRCTIFASLIVSFVDSKPDSVSRCTFDGVTKYNSSAAVSSFFGHHPEVLRNHECWWTRSFTTKRKLGAIHTYPDIFQIASLLSVLG